MPNRKLNPTVVACVRAILADLSPFVDPRKRPPMMLNAWVDMPELNLRQKEIQRKESLPPSDAAVHDESSTTLASSSASARTSATTSSKLSHASPL